MLNNETEVFRLTPEVGKCYEYAESTRKLGGYPTERYFTRNIPQYVGRYVRSDGRTSPHMPAADVFQDNYGKEHMIWWNEDETTCFREVPCLAEQVPSLQNLSRRVVQRDINYSIIPKGHPTRDLIEGKMGGKSKGRRRRKTTRRKTTLISKIKKST